MELVLPHEITYDFDGRASVEEVAKSLLAQERLAREAVAILAACFDGLVVEAVRIDVVSVAQESPLKEILAAAVFLTFQEDLEREVPDLIQRLTGGTIPQEYDTLITVFVMIAAIYGASYLYERVLKGRKAKAIPEEYDRLVTVAGDYLHITGDAVKEAVDARLGKGRKKAAARLARDFFAPATRHGARAIRSSGAVEIGGDALGEIPSDADIEAFEPETDSYVVEDTVVQFQAHDLGAHKRGWAAIVPAVSPRRRPLHLDPTIPAPELFTRKQVRGDVLVFAEADEDGEYEPKLYYLQKLKDGDGHA